MSNGAEKERNGSVVAFEQIPVERIDRGQALFAFAFPREPDEALIASVKELGLVVPVALQGPCAGRYRIVCGHRRIAASEAAGLREVPARPVDRNLPEHTLFLLNVLENAALRPANDMERALALHRLVSDFKADDTVVFSGMGRLGLEPSQKILARYTRLVRLSPALQRYIVSHGISIRVSTRLAGLPLEDQAALSSLLTAVSLGGNALRELLDLAEEIALRDGIGLRRIFSESPLAAIIQDTRRTVTQKRERVKQHLTEMRYPILTARRDEILALLKKGCAVPGVSLTPPPYLEGRELRLAFSFQSVAELREKLVRLEGASLRVELEKALALLAMEEEA